jgi:hypothetical protein
MNLKEIEPTAEGVRRYIDADLLSFEPLGTLSRELRIIELLENILKELSAAKTTKAVSPAGVPKSNSKKIL